VLLFFRKNAAHKKAFAHPGDSDYSSGGEEDESEEEEEEGEEAEEKEEKVEKKVDCKFGAACTRYAIAQFCFFGSPAGSLCNHVASVVIIVR
jgi:hypothetical protein